ncbi:MAG TPA: hypothetical protein VK712_01385 [Verrucomicrobiae bacterium]|jgi:hypothetical protein|nr:hypothetical protein [Verrucomicrobiae bacterium]
MYKYEMTEGEAVKGLSIIGLSVLGGVAVAKEAAKLGMPAPLAAVLGIGTATASVLFGQDILLDPEAVRQRSYSYPPHRGMDI